MRGLSFSERDTVEVDTLSSAAMSARVRTLVIKLLSTTQIYAIDCINLITIVDRCQAKSCALRCLEWMEKTKLACTRRAGETGGIETAYGFSMSPYLS